MYGVAGERRLDEFEADWLPGFEGSRPVRIGNAASEQVQLDVYGEIIDAFYTARLHGLEASDHAWQLSVNLLEFLETAWRASPTPGIWEVRGPNRALHPLEGDGVGRVRPRGAHGRGAGTGRGPSTTGGRSATRSTPTSA